MDLDTRVLDHPQVTDQQAVPTSRWGSHGRRRALVASAVVALLVQMTVAMMWSAAGDSPTYDEPADLAAAVAYVRHHDLRFNPEHPPLAKALSGLPFLVAELRAPTDSAEYIAADDYAWGRQLLFGAGNDPLRTMWLARLPMIGMSLVLALVVFGFGRDLFGAGPALIGLALVAVCPTVLAHGRLVHTDVAVTTFVVATMWFLWRAARGPSWWYLIAGVTFGLALGSKFTALVFIPVVAGLAGLGAWGWPARPGAGASGAPGAQGKADGDPGVDRASPPSAKARLIRAMAWPSVVVVIAFATLWAVYFAVDPRLRFDRVVATAGAASGAPAAVADLLPVPKPFREGLRFAIHADQAGRTSYLLGETYTGGRLEFYPLLLVMKSPLASIAVWTAGLVALVRRPWRWDVAIFAVAPAAAFLVFASVSDTNIGIRHVLVVPVMLAVTAGSAWRLVRGRPVAVAVLGAALVLAGASVWGQHPSYLAYVNEAFGGRDRAAHLVSDSNVDWGQDLRRLGAWLREHHPGEEAWLAYFGTVPPSAYGVPAGDATTVPVEELGGIFAVSATLESSFTPGRFRPVIDGLQPIARIGGSILVYDLG